MSVCLSRSSIEGEVETETGIASSRGGRQRDGCYRKRKVSV